MISIRNTEASTISVEVNKRHGEEQKLQDEDCNRKQAVMETHADSLSEPERRRPIPESRSPITGLIPNPENRTTGRYAVKGVVSNPLKDKTDYKSAAEIKSSSAKTGVMPPKKTITFESTE